MSRLALELQQSLHAACALALGMCPWNVAAGQGSSRGWQGSACLFMLRSGSQTCVVLAPCTASAACLTAGSYVVQAGEPHGKAE